MYITAAPVSLSTITDDNISTYISQFKACKLKRILLCVVDDFASPDNVFYKNPERVKKYINILKSENFEVGIWISVFGHGIVLAHDTDSNDGESNNFTQLQGVNGGGNKHGICPLDENFAKSFRAYIQAIAKTAPDIIMLDDDFRLNNRPSYYMGCFCPLHQKKFFEMIGEELPLSELESLIFTGGKNKYRSAYMKLSAETLLNFAKMLRSAIDEVDSGIRLGAAAVLENWDYCGTDAIEIARAFAGNTKPFLRTIGAPYWDGELSDIIEDTRLQLEWCKGSDVEVFTEGDVYPRPRYNVPSKLLEFFDLALIADGSSDGILKYMFDYNRKPNYETGYIERHIKNESLRASIAEIFGGKSPIGVNAVNVLHKVENWHLPDKCEEGIALKMIDAYKSTSRMLLARNSIPSAFNGSGLPMLICGENARYVDLKDLKYGAVLDIVAARILTERGVDVGFISEAPGDFKAELHISENDEIFITNQSYLMGIRCNDGAQIISRFMPENVVSSYSYENGNGERFYVLGCDVYASNCNEAEANYFNNYHRQNELISAFEYVGRKKLPVTCPSCPKLYILASTDGDAMSVLMLNIFPDEVISPEIKLGKEYNEIRFVCGSGKLCGDTVELPEIPPYGICAFEVK